MTKLYHEINVEYTNWNYTVKSEQFTKKIGIHVLIPLYDLMVYADWTPGIESSIVFKACKSLY